jgi:hypothetical protein
MVRPVHLMRWHEIKRNAAGLVGDGEEVILEREPRNQYDRNAIRVLNIQGVQIGHISKAVAAKLVSVPLPRNSAWDLSSVHA